MQLSQEWDKVFPRSEKVDHKEEVTFRKRSGSPWRRISICRRTAWVGAGCARHIGPFGAVKEQPPACMRRAWRNAVSSRWLPTRLHRGKRRRAAQRCLAGHQHRGLQRGRRLPRPAVLRGSRAHRRHRNLRLGRHGIECRRSGQARESRRDQHHVRHDARHVQGLQRQRDPDAAHADAGATGSAALAGCGRMTPASWPGHE